MLRSSFVGAIVILMTGSALAAQTPSPVGNWARTDGETKIKVSACGKDLCAVNTWVKDPKGDEAVGDRLVMTLQPKSDSELDGTAYDVKRKSTYNLTLTLTPSGMTTKGCVVAGIVCKGVEWTRTK